MDMLIDIGMVNRFRESSRMQVNPTAHFVILDDTRYNTFQ